MKTRFKNAMVIGCAFACWWVALRGGAADAPSNLWPGRAPGETKELPAERDTTQATDGLIAGRRLIRLGNVSEPTLEVFPAPESNRNGAAVLVCPGGGYHILAMDLEGTEVCQWLNSIGVTGVLLKYRVPRREGLEKHAAPLQDAQRAMGIVRRGASDWGIDPKRVGVLGFSAGGHLAAALSTTSQRTYPKVDEADELSCRPDFSVLVYPGYLTVKEENDRVSSELKITSETPPTFLVMAQDDPVRVENVFGYAMGLKQANVPFEVHVYPTGGHGYGLRRTANPVTAWPDRVAEWLKARGVLERPQP